MKTLVTIATYKHTDTACFLKEKLESENIDCYFVLLGDVEEKMEYVSVQVNPEDVEAAIKMMMSIKDEYGKNIEELKSTSSIRKIVVPVDFTKGSEDACYYAIHLAQKLEAEIKLLHVFENPYLEMKIYSSDTYVRYLHTYIEDEKQKANTAMIDFMQRIKSYLSEKNIKGVFVHSVIVMGHIVRSLKSVCKNYEPDLIVLGTQGRREGTKSIFAGVVKELVNELKIPVFAIPGPCAAKDFDNMKILYATDFNADDHTSLNQLLKITESFKKQITCIHIDTAHNPAKEERIEELNDFLKKEYAQYKIQCMLIDYVNVSQGIRDFADSNNMNMLSFTVHNRGIFELLFMPNLFKKILMEAGIPILIFPSNYP